MLKILPPPSASQRTRRHTGFWWGHLFPVKEWNELLHKQGISTSGPVLWEWGGSLSKANSQPVWSCLNKTAASLTRTYMHIQTNKLFKTMESLFLHHSLASSTLHHLFSSFTRPPLPPNKPILGGGFFLLTKSLAVVPASAVDRWSSSGFL